jgi:UDP-N-acetyl-D-mannosaminuronic acid dehydrogenase
MSFETISVIGLGYIGLPTAAIFASCEKKVIGVDINKKTVDTINRGEIHIVEPDLAIMVRTSVTAGYLRAVTVPEPADAFLIAVPTPIKTNKLQIPEPNLCYVEAAAISIAPVLKKGALVILESTFPVGTTEQFAQWLSKLRPDLSFPHTMGSEADINIAHCPERVLPGQVVRELVQNDRVIGGLSEKCSDRAIELYKMFVKGECVSTNARTAEMAKLTENSCRDVQIAFANELSTVCDKLDIDIWELIALANRHPRINILQPGPGVGGHCIAVDPWFIVSQAPNEAKIIQTARRVNDSKPVWVINKVKIAITEFLKINPEKTANDIIIACYGLAFKPDIDDLRESPSLYIFEYLSDWHSGETWCVEPNIKVADAPDKIKNVSVSRATNNADIHVFLVKHKEFLSINEKPQFCLDFVGCFR